jgi:hypothetical protein
MTKSYHFSVKTTDFPIEDFQQFFDLQSSSNLFGKRKRWIPAGILDATYQYCQIHVEFWLKSIKIIVFELFVPIIKYMFSNHNPSWEEGICQVALSSVLF